MIVLLKILNFQIFQIFFFLFKKKTIKVLFDVQILFLTHLLMKTYESCNSKKER
jgi:hypothetical protein